MKAIRDMAENIIGHLEICGGLPVFAHGKREENINTVEGVIETSLYASGFVRIEFPGGLGISEDITRRLKDTSEAVINQLTVK